MKHPSPGSSGASDGSVKPLKGGKIPHVSGGFKDGTLTGKVLARFNS